MTIMNPEHPEQNEFEQFLSKLADDLVARLGEKYQKDFKIIAIVVPANEAGAEVNLTTNLCTQHVIMILESYALRLKSNISVMGSA